MRSRSRRTVPVGARRLLRAGACRTYAAHAAAIRSTSHQCAALECAVCGRRYRHHPHLLVTRCDDECRYFPARAIPDPNLLSARLFIGAACDIALTCHLSLHSRDGLLISFFDLPEWLCM
jgi:hypothetical protein